MEKIEILGKKYQIQTGLSSEELFQIHREIQKKIKMLSQEYPTLDKVDILILYVIELNEKIITLDKKLKKETGKLESIKKKILALEEKIKNTINLLTY